MQRTLEGFIAYLRVEYQSSDLTIAAYLSDLKAYAQYSQSAAAHWDSPDTANNYLVQIASKYKPATLWRKRSAIARFFRFLWEENLITENISNTLHQPPMPDVMPKALTLEQTSTLIEELSRDTSPEGIRKYASVITMYDTGTRVTECIQIKLSDIHQDRILIKGKRNKERWVFMTGRSQNAIAAYMQIRSKWAHANNEYLFGRGARSAILRQTVGRWIRETSRLLGMHASPHVLRHSQATHLLPHINIIDLAAILGHTNVSTTSRYLNVRPENLRKKITQFHPMSDKKQSSD